jgi:hypothetical protein
VLSTPANQNYGCKAASPQDKGQNGSQNVDFVLQDTNLKFSNYVYNVSYTDERPAVGLNEVPKNGAAPVNPLYHAILSSVRIPVTAFGKPAGFDITKVKAIWVWLNPGYNPSFSTHGSLFFSDIWATTAAASAVQSAPERTRVALPGGMMTPGTNGLAAVAGPAEATETVADLGGAAAEGSSIVAAVRKAGSPPSSEGGTERANAAVVEFTFATAGQMVSNDSGFFVQIGGKPVPAQLTGSAIEPNLTSLTVSAADVDAAPDGATVVVTSGGSAWHFGSLEKSQIR